MPGQDAWLQARWARVALALVNWAIAVEADRRCARHTRASPAQVNFRTAGRKKKKKARGPTPVGQVVRESGATGDQYRPVQARTAARHAQVR